MDQELLMKQIVEQVMYAMQNGGSAPAAPEIGRASCRERV